MKVQGDAETSARTGVPTYNVQEGDRSVWWTITIHDLIRFQEWDELNSRVRLTMIGNWQRGEESPYAFLMPTNPAATDRAWRKVTDLSILEQHAIVARNTLRNFLGHHQQLPAVRKLHLYAQPSAGWLGWITVNDKVEAWVTTEGEIIEDARINYGGKEKERGPPDDYASAPEEAIQANRAHRDQYRTRPCRLLKSKTPGADSGVMRLAGAAFFDSRRRR